MRTPLTERRLYAKLVADTIKQIRKDVVKCHTIGYSIENIGLIVRFVTNIKD